MHAQKSALKNFALITTLLMAANSSYADGYYNKRQDDKKQRPEECLPFYMSVGAGWVDPIINGPAPSAAGDGVKFTTNAIAYSLAVGKFFHEFFRADLELNHRSKSKYEQFSSDALGIKKFSATSGFLNGAFEFAVPEVKKLNAFITAGIGGSYNKTTDLFVDETSNQQTGYLLGATANQDTGGRKHSSKSKFKFAWQAGAGLSARMSKNVSLDFTGKYVNRGKTQTSNIRTASAQGSTAVSDFNTGRSAKIKIHEVLALVSLRINS